MCIDKQRTNYHNPPSLRLTRFSFDRPNMCIRCLMRAVTVAADDRRASLWLGLRAAATECWLDRAGPRELRIIGGKYMWLTANPDVASFVSKTEPAERENTRFLLAQVDKDRENLSTLRNSWCRNELRPSFPARRPNSLSTTSLRAWCR